MAGKRPNKKKAADDGVPANICFVIMPFGGWFDVYYRDVFRSAIERAGLRHHRADDLFRTGTIVKDIWELIRSATLILADLTGKNPNVLYELGLAHAIAKPVILLTQTIDDVPFDLRGLRVLPYDKNSPNWGEALSVRITKAIEETLAAPLSGVLPAFLHVADEAPRAAVSAHEKAMLEMRQELDSLRTEIVGRTSEEPRLSAISRQDIDRIILEMLRNGQSPQEMRIRLADMGFTGRLIDRMIPDGTSPQAEQAISESGVGG
jgi:hypothetical protein